MEKATAENSVINDAPLENKTILGGGIDSTTPNAAAEGIESLRMFGIKQGFGFAIAGLLFEVRRHRTPAIMPHKSGRAEPDLQVLVLKSPADINVITGFMFFIGMPFFYVDNWIFQMKIAGIVLAAALLLLYCTASFRKWDWVGPNDDAPGLAKFVAFSSTVLWIVVVVLGRYIPLGAPN